MNFALLFFITLFTGILATNRQPLRAEIKDRFNDDGDCNAAGTMNLCGNGTVWNATATATATDGRGQCVLNLTDVCTQPIGPYNCFIAGFCYFITFEALPTRSEVEENCFNNGVGSSTYNWGYHTGEGTIQSYSLWEGSTIGTDSNIFVQMCSQWRASSVI